MKSFESKSVNQSIFDLIENAEMVPQAFKYEKFVTEYDSIKRKQIHSFIAFPSFFEGTGTKFTYYLTRNSIYQSHEINPKQIVQRIKLRNPRITTQTDYNSFSEKANCIKLHGYKGSIDFKFENENIMNLAFEYLKKMCIQLNLNDNYKPKKIIGQGAFSKVYLSKRLSDSKKFAIKKILKSRVISSKNKLSYVKTELSTLRKLNHPNIVQFIEAFESEEYVYLVLELCDGENLKEYFKNNKINTEFSIKLIMKSIFETLSYLEKNSILHRDLKLENIILINPPDYSKIKFIDFGLSITIGKEQNIKTKVGTLGYMAPELFQKNSNYCKADIFSCGIIFYYLLTGIFPFNGKSEKEIYTFNKNCNIDFFSRALEKVSPLAKELCAKLVEKDPNKRLKAIEALDHPWLSNCSNDENNHNNKLNKRINSNVPSMNADFLVEINSEDNDSILSKSFVNDDNLMNISNELKPLRSPKIISCPSKDSIRMTSVDNHLKLALKKDFLLNLKKKSSIEISPDEQKLIQKLESNLEFQNFQMIQNVKPFLNNTKMTGLQSQTYLKFNSNDEDINEIDSKSIPEEYKRDEDNIQTEVFNASIELSKLKKYNLLYVCDHSICSIKPKISFQNYEKK